MASSSNYSLLLFSSRSSKFPIRLSPMIHSRKQLPLVSFKEKSGGFLGFSGLKEQKELGCSIHVLQRNPSFGLILRRCNKGWRSEMGKEESVEEDDAGINGSLGSSMSSEIGNDVAKRPPMDEEGRYDTEPFFYNEAERHYYYFVKRLAYNVKESLKQLIKALMVIPLSFIILAFALKDKVDVVLKTAFHDDKVSSQEQEDSDEEYIPATNVKV